jgi:hypothetical protein
MFKRAAREAVRAGAVSAEAIADLTDDAFMDLLVNRARSPLAGAVRERRLYKRALDLPASDVPGEQQAWVSDDPDQLEEAENAAAEQCGLAPGELLIDYPTRPSMLSVDLPLVTRSGAVERLTDEGRAGHLGLPRVADELYQSARRLRVFVARAPARSTEFVVDMVQRPWARGGGPGSP